MPNKTRSQTELYQKSLDNLGMIALDVIESLLTDTETSIDVRLHAAFKIIEVYGESDNMGEGVTQSISEKLKDNGKMIENNTKRLTEIGNICNILKETQNR